MVCGVAPRKDIINTCSKEIGLRAQNMKTIIGLNGQHNLMVVEEGLGYMTI